MKTIAGSGDADLTEEKRQRHLRIARGLSGDLDRCNESLRPSVRERIAYHLHEAATIGVQLQLYRGDVVPSC